MTESFAWSFGWTLIHGLWMGALAVGLALAARRLASPRARYGAALTILGGLALSLPVTLVAVSSERPHASLTGAETPAVMPHVGLGGELASLRSTSTSTSTATAPSTSPSTATATGSGLLSGASATPRTASPVGGAPGATAAWLAELRGSLPWLWAAGVLLALARLAAGARWLSVLRAEARPVGSGAVLSAARRAASQLGLRRPVDVAISTRVSSPLVVGIRRPTIVLPADRLDHWSDDELRLVLLHELVHVARHDNLVNLGQHALQCVLLLQPVAWWLSAWARHERELCCDAVVVRRTGAARLYAATLLGLAEPPRPGASLSAAMGRAPVRERIARVLKQEHETMQIPRSLMIPSLALAAIGVALIDVQAQDPAPREAPSMTESLRLPLARPALAADRVSALDPPLAHDPVSEHDPESAHDSLFAHDPVLAHAPAATSLDLWVAPGDTLHAELDATDCRQCHEGGAYHTAFVEQGTPEAIVLATPAPVASGGQLTLLLALSEPLRKAIVDPVLSGMRLERIDLRSDVAVVTFRVDELQPGVLSREVSWEFRLATKGGRTTAPIAGTCLVVPSANAPATGSLYVVQAGDTLSRISTKLFGSSQYVGHLRAANLSLDTQATLHVGQQLQVPVIATPDARSPAARRLPDFLAPPTGDHGLQARLLELEQTVRQLQSELAALRAAAPRSTPVLQPGFAR